ncbi:MAG: multi-sensor signal transduction histidine kinase [Pedosphaera sp.]|nr:multi-sensor signal transduction histidine kinase [Pedosphaera sp.]
MATNYKRTARGKTRLPPRRRNARMALVARSTNDFVDRDRLIGELELQLTQFRLQEQHLRQEQQAAEQLAEYYAGLFNAAPVGYLVLNPSGSIVEINEAGATLLRLTRKRVLGEPFVQFLPKDDIVGFLNYLRRCKDSKKRVTTELQLRGDNGGTRPVEMVSETFAGPDHTTQFRAAMIDISDRRRAEQALRESEQNYGSLVNSIQGIVWAGSGTGDFTFVSRQAERILGYPRERWLREPRFWQDRLHPDDRARVIDARSRAVAEKKSYVIEFRMMTAERHSIWMRDSVNVVQEGKTVKLTGVMVNITELKEAEHALREETRTLETMNRIGTSLAEELDLEKLVQVVVEAGKQVTGAKFGAFSYKHLNGHGEKVSLYTTPGVAPEIFARLPLPQHQASVPASEAEREVIRIDDLQQDPRTPRSKSRPNNETLPMVVRSYLAIPVVSRSGEVLGGLLFGHPAPGAFTERAQHLLAGIAAEAGTALDNARLYRAVSKSESHFRQLADAMPQIVWTARPDGRVDYFNRRWYEYTGLPEGAVNEEGWLPFVHPEDRERCMEAKQRVVAANEHLEVECRLRDRAGNHRWHLIRAVPIQDEGGRIASWFGTSTDIEDQKRVEGEVRDLNSALEKRVAERTAQLQASNRELEAFSYSVSHDLRAPLRSIDAFSQLVREDYEDKLDEQGKQYLGLVGEASRQMARLIDDLLHLSRVTRSELRRRPVDMSLLAENIFASLRQVEPKRPVETVVAPGLQAEGDERLLRVALENLINNAWKFTGRRENAHIEVGSEMQDGQQVFYVRDDGAGFDMTYANMLFGAFQRLHSTGEFPGHGIGLATVQRIINRHGGRIWADAAVDRGATFYFTLPKAG